MQHTRREERLIVLWRLTLSPMATADTGRRGVLKNSALSASQVSGKAMNRLRTRSAPREDSSHALLISTAVAGIASIEWVQLSHLIWWAIDGRLQHQPVL